MLVVVVVSIGVVGVGGVRLVVLLVCVGVVKVDRERLVVEVSSMLCVREWFGMMGCFFKLGDGCMVLILLMLDVYCIGCNMEMIIVVIVVVIVVGCV